MCEIFSGKSFKEDPSNDTTFDTCYISGDSTFKTFAGKNADQAILGPTKAPHMLVK